MRLLHNIANFTQSALTKNDEIMTMFDSNDGVKFKEIKDIIDSYYLKSSVMTQEKLNKYIAQSKKNKKETKDNFRLNKSIKDMKWDEYYSLLQEKSNRLEERLKLLTKSCEYFNQNTFENMTELQRKNIAGVLKRGNSIDDWFLFGHMPSQLFANRVSTDDKRGERGVVKSYMKISKALDFIPLTGEVSKKNFDNYIAYFEEYSGWGYSLSTVSRLLAMKRPDQFFCVTGINNKEKKGNFRKLKDTFKINNKIKIYEQYWNEIIEPIRQAPWYKASKPTNEQEFQVWRGRVALMDALLYNN